MTRRNRRLVLIGLVLGVLGLAAALALSALRESIVFFVTPSELAARPVEPGKRLRIGGLVKEGSVRRDGLQASFTVTDGARDLEVVYRGVLPDLFREKQGVVAEGRRNLHAEGSRRRAEEAGYLAAFRGGEEEVSARREGTPLMLAPSPLEGEGWGGGSRELGARWSPTPTQGEEEKKKPPPPPPTLTRTPPTSPSRGDVTARFFRLPIRGRVVEAQ
jgi:cytochrome c-type biogenesis protein CcmE